MRNGPALPAIASAQRHAGQRHASSTEPIRSMVTTIESPAETGVAAVSPPERITSPRRSPSPSAASDRTSQATAASGAASLGHPASAVAWLVRALAADGAGLRRGDVILSGGLTAATPVSAGDSITVTIDRIGSVELACR